MSEFKKVENDHQDHKNSDYDDGIMTNYNPDDIIPVNCTNKRCHALLQCTHKDVVGEICLACGHGVTYPSGLSRLNWSSLDQKNDYKHDEIPSFLIKVITLNEWKSILDHIDYIDQINYCSMRKIPKFFQKLNQNQWDEICDNLCDEGKYKNCRTYLNPEICPFVLMNKLTRDEWRCVCGRYNKNIYEV